MLTINKITKRLFYIEDYFFERLHNLKLSGNVKSNKLSTNSKYKEQTWGYQPVLTTNLRILFSELKNINIKKYHFIDVGCGKGKPCFYASRFPFKTIKGFDFDNKLIDEARKNIVNSRFINTTKISFEINDATTIILENKPYIIFLFNPFSGEVLNLFLKNNAKNIKASNGYIIYSNDRQKKVLDNYKFTQVWNYSIRKLSIWK